MKSRVTAATAIVASLLVAPAAASASLPDLVATGGQVTGPVSHYVFADTPTRIVWWDSTKNIGSAPAPASNTRIFFSEKLADGGRGGVNWSPGWREVGPLKRGASSKGSVESTRRTAFLSWIGRYFTFACANRPTRLRESDSDNNCKNLGERFSVVPRRWEGTVKGTGWPYDGIEETWSADVTFAFDREISAGSGSFVYRVKTASVGYSASGTDTDGCTVSGSSPRFSILDRGESGGQSFRLFNSTDNVHVGSYSGFGMLPSGLHYTVSHTCPNPANNWTEMGPLGTDSNWFNTLGVRPLPSIVGYTQLHRLTAQSPAPIQYEWTLDAE